MLIINLILAQISLLIFPFEHNKIRIILWLPGQDIQNLIKKCLFLIFFQFIFESTFNFTVSPSDNLFLKYYCQR